MKLQKTYNDHPSFKIHLLKDIFLHPQFVITEVYLREVTLLLKLINKPCILGKGQFFYYGNLAHFHSQCTSKGSRVTYE